MAYMQLSDDKKCFACGSENPIGLKLEFKTTGKKTKAEFIPKKEHQGYKDIVHGGVLSTILDEAIVRLAYEIGHNAVSVNINVNFRKAAKVGEKLFLEGEINKEEGRKVFGKSRVTNPKGDVVADCEGILVKIKKE